MINAFQLGFIFKATLQREKWESSNDKKWKLTITPSQLELNLKNRVGYFITSAFRHSRERDAAWRKVGLREKFTIKYSVIALRLKIIGCQSEMMCTAKTKI